MGSKQDDLRVDTFRNRLTIALATENKRPVDLAEITGIGKSAISQYLAGKNVPKTDKVYLIAKALNVQEAWLMGYSVPMRRPTKTLTAEIAQEHFDLITKFDDLTAENQNMVLKMIEGLLKTQ